MKLILKPAEGIYRGINALRRAAYRRGILRAQKLPRPVVSIGNIAIGGSGKTPSTIALAKALSELGVRVAILTRGYGRSSDQIARVASDDPKVYGDEPVLMRRALGDGVPVIVGADRFAAGSWFLREEECDLFLLDDAMQHLQLARDVEIVVVSDAKWYREGRGALRAADAILRRDTAMTLPAGILTFDARLQPTRVVTHLGESSVEALRGRRAIAFAGLANNEQFFEMLRQCGVELRTTRSFPDHHDYSKAEIDELQQSVRSGELLLTTAKDAVKIGSTNLARVDVEMQIDRLDELVGLILRKSGLRTD